MSTIRPDAERSTQRRSVAIILDLDWPYKRQVEVYRGIIEQCERYGWEHSLIPLAEQLSAEEELQEQGGLPYDGIIARATVGLANEALKAGIPLVNVWMNSPVHSQVPTVTVDSAVSGHRAAKHLVARGLRNLAYLGGQRLVDSRMAYDGMRAVAKKYGCSLSRLLIEQNYNRNRDRWSGYQSRLSAWIDSLQVPFGVFTSVDLHARYFIEACKRKGLRVPEDVAVIGCGNELPLCLQPTPTLTSVDEGFLHVGIRSVELLADLMNGQDPPTGAILVSEANQLFARQSTDSFAVNDPLVTSALRYISENCHKPINVEDVVNNVAASRRTLERRFSETLNRSITSELCRLRVRRLERMLVDSNEPLTILADSCGFIDTEQMRRNFQQIHGTTPSEYRMRLRG